MLLLKELTRFEQLSEVHFVIASFWTKAIDIPPIKQTSYFAKLLGNHLSTFVGYDEVNLLCAVDKFVNVQSDADITKPLCRGIHVMVQGKPLWISFKYVKLSDFCCGYLGHVVSGCDMATDVVDESNLQYGEWLRRSPIKSRRILNAAAKQEEKQLFLAYRSGYSSSKAKAKLSFDSLKQSLLFFPLI